MVRPRGESAASASPRTASNAPALPSRTRRVARQSGSGNAGGSGTAVRRKGLLTREAILQQALQQAARHGLESLTIGALAEAMQMSKSGVFAHFGSREDLQCAVLHAYEVRFVDEVLRPSLQQPRGLPRLQSIVTLWMERMVLEASRGCLWLAAASEYDDRPGPVRDELVAMVRQWQGELRRAVDGAIDAGHLSAQTDIDEMLFRLYGVMLALHHQLRLMGQADAIVHARAQVDALLRGQPCAAAGVAPVHTFVPG